MPTIDRNITLIDKSKTLILMQGCSGSGKSTVAKWLANGFNWQNIKPEVTINGTDKTILFGELGESPSAIHSTDNYFIVDGEYRFDKSKLSENHGKNIAAVEADMKINRALIIVDNTNTKYEHAKRYMDLAKKYGYTIRTLRVEADLDECNNIHGVDRRRMVHQYDEMEQLLNRPPEVPQEPTPIYDNSLRDACIFDMDGTLALLNGRNPYDASSCGSDLVNEPVRICLEKFQRNSYMIIIVSGRKSEHRKETEDWLRNHKIYYDYLYMRAEEDNRDDRIVKKEIYDEHIRGKYNVFAVWDDRNKVVDMWRKLGLTCFQVAPGNF